MGIPITELVPLVMALLAAGLFTGLLAGIFGVGGGTVIVPVLYEVFRLMDVPENVRMPLCVGTSLAIIVPTSVRSFRAHLAKEAADIALLKLWFWPVVAGVLFGGIIAADAPAWLFKSVFIVVAGLSAIKLLFGKDGWQIADTLPGRAMMSLYGFVIGGASALMGIGGGAMSNLLLTLYGRPIHRSVATSAGLGVIISVPGMLAYVIAGWSKMAFLPPLSLGYVSIIGTALIIPTSILAAPWGVRIAHSMPPRRLELALGLYLMFVAGRFLIGMVD